MNTQTNSGINLSRRTLLMLGFCLFQTLQAQTVRQKSTYWQLGAGNTYVYDDYLSPLSHAGGSLLIHGGASKPLKYGLPDSLDVTFDHAKWISQCSFTISPAYTSATYGSSILHGSIDLRSGLLKKIITQPSLSAYAGAYFALGGGGRYCLQNGNNPGSADLSTHLGMTLLSDYRFNLWNKAIKLTYQGSLALAGLAFSPEYAESYYEIFYVGNSNNILKFTTPYNMQQWRQQLYLDIPFSGRKSSLRLGYQNDGRVSLLNNIRTRILTNHFSIGYIRYFNTL